MATALKAKRVASVIAAPFMPPLKKALNHGGTQRRAGRNEAKRKHVQIATVDPASGRPTVRTVVFRGFLSNGLANSPDCARPNDESCLLTFVTDSRANKVRHVRSGAEFVECCWWLDEAGVQFRISGRAVLATRDDEDAQLRVVANRIWDRIGDSTRNTFRWPDPGLEVGCQAEAAVEATEQPGSAGDAAMEEPPSADELPSLDDAHFAVFIVIPETVDELHLGGRQRRYIHRLEGGEPDGSQGPLCLPEGAAWTTTEVNP